MRITLASRDISQNSFESATINATKKSDVRIVSDRRSNKRTRKRRSRPRMAR